MATEEWGSGEVPLCLRNMIKELTPDLLGVVVFFLFFAFVSSIIWRLMLGGDVSEGQMKGSTEPLNLHQHHNGYSWTEEMWSLSKVWPGQDGGGGKKGVWLQTKLMGA